LGLFLAPLVGAGLSVHDQTSEAVVPTPRHHQRGNQAKHAVFNTLFEKQLPHDTLPAFFCPL